MTEPIDPSLYSNIAKNLVQHFGDEYAAACDAAIAAGANEEELSALRSAFFDMLSVGLINVARELNMPFPKLLEVLACRAAETMEMSSVGNALHDLVHKLSELPPDTAVQSAAIHGEGAAEIVEKITEIGDRERAKPISDKMN